MMSAALCPCNLLPGHPIPDVLVHTSFPIEGAATIRVEIEPRCFEESPEEVLYTFKEIFETDFTDEDREKLIETTRGFVHDVVAFEFEPGGKVEPKFEFTFEFTPGAELEQDDDVLYILAKAEVPLSESMLKYRIHALDHGDLNVIFRNNFGGTELEEFQVLFPGESSHWLNLAEQSLRASTLKVKSPERTFNFTTGMVTGLLVIIGAIVVLCNVRKGKRQQEQ